MSGKPKHDYHLVDPSPWPLLGTLAGVATALGFLFLIHPDLINYSLPQDGSPLLYNITVLAPGALLLLLTFYLWWRDVIREGRLGFHTAVVAKGLRLGMGLFILSEVMFFVGFFWAFFYSSLFVDEIKLIARYNFTGGVWPPKGIVPIATFELPFVNTLILLLSGTTLTWAHHSLKENNREGLVRGLSYTILLGLLFSAIQLFEYLHAPFALGTGSYGATFYMATGFHGAHVIIGTIFLAICWLRARQGDFTPTKHFGLEAAAWYWHFVDVVWLFLFVSIYWWGGHGAG